MCSFLVCPDTTVTTEFETCSKISVRDPRKIVEVIDGRIVEVMRHTRGKMKPPYHSRAMVELTVRNPLRVSKWLTIQWQRVRVTEKVDEVKSGIKRCKIIIKSECSSSMCELRGRRGPALFEVNVEECQMLGEGGAVRAFGQDVRWVECSEDFLK